MLDFPGLDVEFGKLKLGAFPAIDENVLIVYDEQLSRLVPVVGRNGRIVPQDFEQECQMT